MPGNLKYLAVSVQFNQINIAVIVYKLSQWN